MTAAGIDQTLQSFDTLMVDLSVPVVAGVLQAFDVLSFGLTRGLTTGQWPAWSKASLEDAESALARLRDSNIGLLNAIYAAVIRLIISAWYLIPENAADDRVPRSAQEGGRRHRPQRLRPRKQRRDGSIDGYPRQQRPIPITAPPNAAGTSPMPAS